MTQAARIKQDPAQVRDEARIQAIVDRVREQTHALQVARRRAGEQAASRPTTSPLTG